jgi:hypothetical protein
MHPKSESVGTFFSNTSLKYSSANRPAVLPASWRGPQARRSQYERAGSKGYPAGMSPLSKASDLAGTVLASRCMLLTAAVSGPANSALHAVPQDWLIHGSHKFWINAGL